MDAKELPEARISVLGAENCMFVRQVIATFVYYMATRDIVTL